MKIAIALLSFVTACSAFAQQNTIEYRFNEISIGEYDVSKPSPYFTDGGSIVFCFDKDYAFVFSNSNCMKYEIINNSTDPEDSAVVVTLGASEINFTFTAINRNTKYIQQSSGDLIIRYNVTEVLKGADSCLLCPVKD